MMGSLRKRGTIWWVRWHRNGRKYEESSRSTNYEAARRLLRRREAAVAIGAPVTPAIGRLKFEEAMEDMRADLRTNKRKSVEHVKRRLDRALLPYFRGFRMTDISRADITKFVDQRQKAGVRNSTINRELAALRRMFSLAIENDKLLSKPRIKMLEENNTRKGFFERDAFERVRAHLPEALRGIATFGYYTGWRTKSEILTLQWTQVDREAGTVRLEPGTTKNKQGRTFVIGPIAELREVIEQQWTAHEALKKGGEICPWVFFRIGGKRAAKPGRPKPVKHYRRAWVAACTAAGVPGRLVHDLRRTACRNLERMGVSRSVAMLMVGHRTESIYRRYAIASEEDLREASAKLNALGTNLGTGGTSGQATASKASA
jgi:integrase